MPKITVEGVGEFEVTAGKRLVKALVEDNGRPGKCGGKQLSGRILDLVGGILAEGSRGADHESVQTLGLKAPNDTRNKQRSDQSMIHGNGYLLALLSRASRRASRDSI